MILRALKPTRRGKVDVDLFAGGGGASDGKRRATGRSPHVAVNHWPIALAMHEFRKANGKLLTKTEQVRLVGNSVCPDVAEALIRTALRLRRKKPRPVAAQVPLWNRAAA